MSGWGWLHAPDDPPPPPEPEPDWSAYRSCCGCRGVRCDCVCCGALDD